MEFRILGPLEAGNPPLALGGGKQRALLAVLLLSAGRTVARDRLIDDLWGDDVPETAAKMVQIHVSHLRKVLPPGLLVTRAPGYALQVAPRDVDLHRAEGVLAQARAAHDGGDPTAAADALHGALALWRGPALAEFEEPFAAAEAARVEELRLCLTEERIDADLALGRHWALAGELEVLVARHPLRERLRGQLMLALYRCGRQAEALAALQEGRLLLGEELGLEPSPALRELERLILRQDPGLDPAPARRPTTRPATRGAHPAMVGRDAELARLASALDTALAGETRLVVVSGEAGLGKTTLVEALLAGATRGGDPLVARGQCVEQHGAGEAYMPVLDALGDLCGPDGDPDLVDILETRAPMWLAQLPRLVGDDRREELERRLTGTNPARMLREGVDALVALGTERPVVVVLEDLHWSDPSTVDLLGALARRPARARLLMVGTLRRDDAAGRDHPAGALLGELAARGLLEEVALAPLGADHVTRYVAGRLPGVTLDEDDAGLMVARSRGNPLFLEKAVDAWVDDGRAREDGGVWHLEAAVAELAADVPDTLRKLIRDRLRQVPEQHRDLVEAGSVGGAEFSAALAAAAAGRTVDEAEAALGRLARAGLVLAERGVERWPDGTTASRYGFTHGLCQEVLYQDLDAGRRARLHLSAGHRLAAAYGERADEIAAELAAHFACGGDGGRAARHMLAAARRASGRQAPREAIEHAGAGLTLVEQLPAGREREEVELGLQSVLGPSLIAVEGWTSEGAERALARAREAATALGRAEEVGRALFGLATIYEVRGDYDRSERLLEESLALAGEDSAGLRIDSHEHMACTLFHQGAFDGALESADKALSAYDGRYENPLTAAYGATPGVASHMWAGHALWFLGREDDALARTQRALELGERLGTAHALAVAHAQVAVLACMRDDPGPARRHGDAAVAAAKEGAFAYRVAMGMVARGWAMAAQGEPDEGIGELRRGVALSRATGARMDDAFFLGLIADACARAGRAAEALATLDEARAAVPRDGRYFWDAELSRLRGELLVREGRREEGETEMRRALRVARDQGSPMLERRAREALEGARAPDPR